MLWFKVIPQSNTPPLCLHLTYGLNDVVRSELRADERRRYLSWATKSLANLSNQEQATQGAIHGPSYIHTVSERSSRQPCEVLTRHHRPWFTDVCLMAQTNYILLKLNADGVINVGVRLMKYCWMEHVCTMKYSDDNTRRSNSSL